MIGQPQKYKFSRSETLTDEENKKDNDSFDYLQSENQANSVLRNSKKFNCYVMELSGRDISEEVKSLSLAVEEGVN